jgi:hypothetical protein
MAHRCGKIYMPRPQPAGPLRGGSVREATHRQVRAPDPSPGCRVAQPNFNNQRAVLRTCGATDNRPTDAENCPLVTWVVLLLFLVRSPSLETGLDIPRPVQRSDSRASSDNHCEPSVRQGETAHHRAALMTLGIVLHNDNLRGAPMGLYG